MYVGLGVDVNRPGGVIRLVGVGAGVLVIVGLGEMVGVLIGSDLLQLTSTAANTNIHPYNFIFVLKYSLSILETID